MSQETLCEISGVSREQISRLELGLCEPHRVTAMALSRALDIDLAELFPHKAQRLGRESEALQQGQCGGQATRTG